MNSDPGIEPTRAARKAISGDLNNDPAKLVAYYIELQKRFENRLRTRTGRAARGVEDGAAQQMDSDVAERRPKSNVAR